MSRRDKIGAAAVRYMRTNMAMSEPMEDQEQNWTLRHLVVFAGRMVARHTPKTHQPKQGSDR